MYQINKRLEMRHYLEQGLSKSATARRVGISRRTLYNWIEAGELERDPDDMTVQYGPRPPRPRKIDPYTQYIDGRLSEYPELSAARLFREIRDQGYPGDYGQVKCYVREWREAVADGDGSG